MDFIEQIAALYGALPAELTEYPRHEGGRNTVYGCRDFVIRVSESSDRTYDDYRAETEFVRYLAKESADTVDALPSRNGRFVERVGGAFISAFTVAKGDQIAAHGYRYREGAPLSEYFYNTGKALGKIHALAKLYRPETRRFDFFDLYTEAHFDALIPNEYGDLKQTLFALLEELRSLPKNDENYGMVHFDFSDGNYNIDYETGKITVFDFENCRTFFYLFDLANLWTHGVGWTMFERDSEKRKAFMDDYFRTILDGYRSETALSDEALSRLPLFVRAVLMENIIDEFEVQKRETGTFENDEEQAYRIRCMVEHIDYMGFFDAGYDPTHPFMLEE